MHLLEMGKADGDGGSVVWGVGLLSAGGRAGGVVVRMVERG